jgi:hypothetical protein
MDTNLKISGSSSWLRWTLVDKERTCLQDFLDRMQPLAGLFVLFFFILKTLLVDSSGTVSEVLPLPLVRFLLGLSLVGCIFLICLTCFGMSVVFDRFPKGDVDVSRWSLGKRIFLFFLASFFVALILFCAFFGVILVQKPM